MPADPAPGAADPALSPAALAEIERYATGIGIDRTELAGEIAAGPGVPRSRPDLITQAHRVGLLVHVFTFATQTAPHSLPPSYHRAGDPPAQADALAEYRAYFRLGVDGVFTDAPDVARAARSGTPIA